MASRFRKSILLTVAALALGLTASSCYGPFKLTKRIYHWNGSFEGKWAKEGMFLVLHIIPVYGIGMLGDGLIFNSIEFWGGNNPIGDCTCAACAKPKK